MIIQILGGFVGNIAQTGRAKQMEDEIFRNKVTWFSFGFSLLVIWVHSYNAELYLSGMPQMAVIYRLQHNIGDGIGQIAVPGFFMISGYLFYRDFTWSKLGEKWNRRIRSILVPYIVELFVLYRIRDWKPIALDDGCCGKRDDTLSAFRPGGCGDSLYL